MDENSFKFLVMMLESQAKQLDVIRDKLHILEEKISDIHLEVKQQEKESEPENSFFRVIRSWQLWFILFITYISRDYEHAKEYIIDLLRL